MLQKRIMLTIKSELTTTLLTIIGVILIGFLVPMEVGAKDKVDYDNDTTLDFTWEAAEGDVDHYNIYVYVSLDGKEYVLDADKGGITVETEYAVENCLDGHTYKIAVEAVDATGNVGPMSDESDPVTVSLIASYASITVLLEGPYASNKTMRTGLIIPTISPYADAREVKTVPENAVDWVYVEVYKEKEKEKVKGESMFLLNDGSIVDGKGSMKANFYNLHQGDYYLVIRHRNHLPIMSNFPVSLVESGASAIDLTVKENIAEASPVKQLEADTYGMYSGDINQNGEITTADFDIWYNSFIAGDLGYKVFDLDLTGEITTTDYEIWFNNFLLGPLSRVP